MSLSETCNRPLGCGFLPVAEAVGGVFLDSGEIAERLLDAPIKRVELRQDVVLPALEIGKRVLRCDDGKCHGDV